MSSLGEWYTQRERGAILGMRIVTFLYRCVGSVVARLLLYPIVGYFFVTGRSERHASLEYLHRLYALPQGRVALGTAPTWQTSFQHFMEFGRVTIDRLGFWLGRYDTFEISVDGMAELDRVASDAQGALILGAHLGSFDVLSLIADLRSPIAVNVMMYTRNAPRINAIFQSLDGDERGMKVRVIEFEPGSFSHALEAKACVERGEVVAILADRQPPNEEDRGIGVDFLGARAVFPEGPMLLASILRCPVLLMFGIREGVHRYRITVERFADQVVAPRKERAETIAKYVQRYADRLAHHCTVAPLQWFNFYDFWDPKEIRARVP